MYDRYKGGPERSLQGLMDAKEWGEEEHREHEMREVS
jgi:hypothetical protein